MLTIVVIIVTTPQHPSQQTLLYPRSQHRLPAGRQSCTHAWSECYTHDPQWGAADAEIKVASVRTQSLKVLPLKPGVGQYIAIHATLTARDIFLAYSFPSGPFT